MPHRKALAASVAWLMLAPTGTAADQPAITPCGDLPSAVRALGTPADTETFGVAAGAAVAVATSPAPGQAGRSILTFTKGGDAPRTIVLSGEAVGLAVAEDGSRAFAIVRSTDRKGSVRSVELTTVDLKTARTGSSTPLPATARGLALGSGAMTLLVACKDEIRTFQLPQLTSGPLYRVAGDNVGVAAIPNSSRVLIAQPSRLVLADLAETQGRDGLTLTHETAAPARLHAMMASVGDPGPIALSDGGLSWCIGLEAFAVVEPAQPNGGDAAGASPPTPGPSPEPGKPLEPAPPLSPTPPPSPAPAREPTPEPVTPPPHPDDAPLQPPPVAPVSVDAPAEAGSLSGSVAGPARGEVAAIVILGPDNVLREAARVIPDGEGRFVARGLPVGSFRLVAAGKGGRVLICDPSFVTIRVNSNSAVEVPVLNVLRAQ